MIRLARNQNETAAAELLRSILHPLHFENTVLPCSQSVNAFDDDLVYYKSKNACLARHFNHFHFVENLKYSRQN